MINSRRVMERTWECSPLFLSCTPSNIVALKKWVKGLLIFCRLHPLKETQGPCTMPDWLVDPSPLPAWCPAYSSLLVIQKMGRKHTWCIPHLLLLSGSGRRELLDFSCPWLVHQSMSFYYASQYVENCCPEDQPGPF